MKTANSPSNGPLQDPVHRAQKSKFHKRNHPFYNRNFSTNFCRFWRLLGRLEEEKKKKEKEDAKKEKCTPLWQRDPKQRFLSTSVGRSLIDDDDDVDDEA